MNTITIIKGAVKTVSGLGAGAIISNACKNLIPEELNILRKVCYGLGAMGIGCVVIDATDSYWDRLFNEIEQMIQMVKASHTEETPRNYEKELLEMKKDLEKNLKEAKKELKKNDSEINKLSVEIYSKSLKAINDLIKDMEEKSNEEA